MPTNTTIPQSPTPTAYIAGSSEKKRAVMMYLGIGIMLAISYDKMSVFEHFHLRQSLGWWMIFMLVVLISIVLMFLPIIWLLGRLVIVAMLIVGGLFAKQAWSGIYYDTVELAQMPLFVGVGGWVLQMFDITISVGSEETPPPPADPVVE